MTYDASLPISDLNPLPTTGSSGGGGSMFTYPAEVPSGTFDGTALSKIATLAHVPASDASILFFRNGSMLSVAGGDFTRVGAVCTFLTQTTTDAAHGGTDVLIAYYS